MWKYLETLAVRIDILQELEEVRPSPRPFTFDTIGNSADFVSRHVAAKERRVNADPYFPSTHIATKSKPIPCTAENCGRAYVNSDRLHDHIRSASGRGHKALRFIIDQTTCLLCGERFQLPASLVRHEKSSANAYVYCRGKRHSVFLENNR